MSAIHCGKGEPKKGPRSTRFSTFLPYQCHLCEKKFKEKIAWKEHDGKKPFNCDICDSTFSERTKQRDHRENIHEEKGT